MRNIALLTLSVFMVFTLGCHRTAENKSKPGGADSLRIVLGELNKKIEGKANDADLYHQRAEIYIALREINQALNDINKAIQLIPGKPGYYNTLSDVYLLMGQPLNCEESLQKALSVDPNNVAASLKLANLYLIIKDYQKTYQYVKQVLTLDKTNAPAHFTRAMALLEDGDTARAIGDLMDAVRLNQAYFEAYMQLAELYSVRKDPITAAWLNNALKIRPGNTAALYMLGMYYQESGQYPKAIGTYEILGKTDTTFKDAPYNIGYINLVYLQDYQTAVIYFTKAVARDPQYAEAWYNRGLSYEQLGNYQKAYDDYQKTLKLKVNYEKAVAGLNRLDKLMKK
jgi:tetratricopeptide (TPR) repeat protein